MSNQQQPPPKKPRIRAPAIWRKRDCQCRQRALLCFGVPLLPPSVTLLGVAYGTDLPFGVFHILGLVLITVSVLCIILAIAITVYRKNSSSKDSKKVGEGREPDLTSPRFRSSSSVTQSSSNGVQLIRMVKIQQTSVAMESESKHRSKKGEKRKRHRKQRTKLPPVKEEDGRARFEKSMEERERTHRKLHKRTKSETRKGLEECVDAAHVLPALTQKHFNMLNILDNQGSQEMKRSVSMSDIGDSASERLSTDFQDSPKYSKSSERTSVGSSTARPVLIHTSSARTGVRMSRFTSVL